MVYIVIVKQQDNTRKLERKNQDQKTAVVWPRNATTRRNTCKNSTTGSVQKSEKAKRGSNNNLDLSA